MTNTYIVSAVRTPIGSLLGSLSSLSFSELGSHALRATVSRAAPLKPEQVDEIYFGNVLSANIGQAPARQVSRGAGLPDSVIATTVNKVCASGMKSVMLGAQTIQLNQAQIVACGGAESMSNVPHYLPGARQGFKYGGGQIKDGIERDALSDAYTNTAMGIAGEDCAQQFGITREEQDEFAVESYTRAQKARDAGKFTTEIAPVEITKRGKTTVVDADEEIGKFDPGRVSKARPVFSKDGTITAVSASKINDGASALILASEQMVQQLGLKPLAKIVGYADAAQAPIKFPSSPALAVEKLLSQTKKSLADIDFFEFNEAFGVVGIANTRLLGLDPAKVNPYGGAVSLGHPVGCSGARIVTTLTSVLNQEGGKLGVAAICNGGGGASAMLIERV